MFACTQKKRSPNLRGKLFSYHPMIFDIPSKKHIAAAFSAKAKGYRSAAFIQHQILCRLVPLIEASDRLDLPWLDAGCGAGDLGSLLKEKKVPVNLVRTDLAFGTLLSNSKGIHRSTAVQSDIEALPFRSMFGGVVASSVLQWLPRQDLGLREIHRALSPGGVMVFSVFLRGSFCQIFSLRQDRNLGIPLRLQSKDVFAGRMRAARFSSLRLATFEEEYYFPSALGVMKYMSGIGSTAVSGRRLLRKEILALCREYEERFATAKGVPLTVRIAYGTATKAL
jgi:malonyl-CoA O-methyltransferase